METVFVHLSRCLHPRALLLLVPIALALVGLLLPPTPQWPQLPLHAALEAMAAAVAIAVAALLIAFPARRGEAAMPAAIPMGLLAIGILSACDAITDPADSFLWLHSLATALGGLGFATLFHPFGQSPAARHRRRVIAAAGGVVVLAVASLVALETLPKLHEDTPLSAWAQGLNLMGAGLFLLAALKLCNLYRQTREVTYRLFALLCGLLGAAAVLLPLSQLWNPPWWWLHLLQWGALTLVFLFFIARLGRAFREQLSAEAYWHAVIDSSSDAIVGTDARGRINLWNRAAEQLFGYSATEIQGQAVAILAPGERAEEEAQLLARIQRGESVGTYETTGYRKGGTPIPVDITLSPIKDQEGRVRGASVNGHEN